MNYLCANQNASTIIIYVVLIVALIAMLVMPYFTQRKKNQEYMKMLDGIHVGDLVKTAGGIIGKVTKITDKGDIKTVVLETGSKSEKSYMELDMTMIYCVLKSTKVAPVESDKVAELETNESLESEKQEIVANPESENVETSVNEEVVEEKKEEEPKKKAVSKKASTKTTSTKTSSAKKSTKK